MEEVQSDLDLFVSSLASLLASPNSFGVFEDFWRSHGKSIRVNVDAIGSDGAAPCLNLLEQALTHAPTAGVYGVDIAHADYLQLRDLDSAYDIWDLLVQCGRRPYIRGKLGTDWETHERHITESYRLEVRARLSLDTEDRISLFRKASNSARKGVTRHCISRANSLEAHAIRLEAEMFVRKRNFSEALKLLEKASALVKGKDLEKLIQFRAYFCRLRDAELRLDWPSALHAHEQALTFAASLPEPEKLFKRPNPWTSFDDFGNESKLIRSFASLQNEGLNALDQAIEDFSHVITHCSYGIRKTEIEARLLFLRGIRASNNIPKLEDFLDQMSHSLMRPNPPKHTQELHDLLKQVRIGKSPSQALDDALRLFPLDAVGSGVPSATPFMFGAPIWLHSVFLSKDLGSINAFLCWYSRIVLDYLWSVYQKNAEEEREAPEPRPLLKSAKLSNLVLQADSLLSLLKWHGTPPGIALQRLIDGLKTFSENSLFDSETLSHNIRVFVRETFRDLFPLVLEVSMDVSGGITLTRLDRLAEPYHYPPSEIDSRSRPQVSASRVYAKPRYKNIMQPPRDKFNRPLFLYPAPSCPVFSPACLLVEGPSDAAFFSTLLDRYEPGWRALRSELQPGNPLIEVRYASGAGNIDDRYKRARDQGVFHSSDPLLDAASERIVVVVDADHAHLFSNAKLEVSRARHVVALLPDLERVAPSAMQNALSKLLERDLTVDERDFLEQTIDLDGKSFSEAIERRFNIALKRQSHPSHATPFAVWLARLLPARETSRPFNRAWDVCERLVILATGPGRIRPLRLLL